MADHRSAMSAGRVLLILTAASALLLSPVGLRLEETIGLPILFGWRGARPPPDTVALVAFDEESVAALGLPDLDQIDRWPRSVHTQVINTLKQKGAAVIALDVAFLAPGNAEVDAQLADAMRAAGNVTILKMLDNAAIDGAADNAAANTALQWQSEPIALFRDAAAAVNAFTLPDHALKRYAWLFPPTPEGIEAAMPMVALQLYYRDARNTLLDILKTLHETPLAAELEQEQRPAFFAARMRIALLTEPALAQRIGAVLATMPDRKAAHRMRGLLAAYQVSDPVYINFYGPQRTIPTVSLYRLLREPDSPQVEALRDRVVFVGLSERFSKQRDYFFTVYPAGDNSRISGVEVAATLFANLHEQRLLHTPVIWQQLLGLWAWGILLTVTARRLPARYWLLLAPLLATVYAVIAATLFRQASLWLPIVIPLLLLTPTLALMAIWHYYRRSDDAERAATAALSLYVPPEVVESVGRNQQQLLEQRRQVDAVCLLTDIVGFTSLCEQHDAAYMHELMNRYYGEVVADVEKHGGVVANIVGDGLLALWPVDGDAITQTRTQAERACRCALAIAATTDRLTTTFNEPLTTCVGIHYGPLSLGHLGAGKHLEYAPVGDTINTTSRIEALTRQLGCRILVSDPVQQMLTGFRLRAHGDFALRGKHEALSLHELLTEIVQEQVSTSE